jgi:hypothetical protein
MVSLKTARRRTEAGSPKKPAFAAITSASDNKRRHGMGRFPTRYHNVPSAQHGLRVASSAYEQPCTEAAEQEMEANRPATLIGRGSGSNPVASVACVSPLVGRPGNSNRGTAEQRFLILHSRVISSAPRIRPTRGMSLGRPLSPLSRGS